LTPSSLPAGWRLTTLGAVCEINPPKPSAKEVAASTPVTFVPMSAVDADTGSIANPEIRTFGEMRSGYTPFREGDVIFAKITPCMENGKVAVAEGLAGGLGFGSTEFHVLRPSDEIDTSYLWHYVRQESFRQTAEARMTGSVGQRRVPRDFLRDAPIPLPPTRAEQRRIAAQIDKLAVRSSSVVRRLDGVPDALSDAVRSLHRASASGETTAAWREGRDLGRDSDDVIAERLEVNRDRKIRRGVPREVAPSAALADAGLTVPLGWALRPVADLLRSGLLLDVKDGNHGANHPKVAEFTSDGLPFITAAQVHDAIIDYASAPKVGGDVLARLRVGFAEPNDVILTHKGTVGRVAVADRECVLTPQTTYYRCDNDALLPGYLAIFLSSAWFYVQLARVMAQTTRDFVPISEQYKLFIAVPPAVEQQRIAEHAAAVRTVLDVLQARVDDALEQTRLVGPSLLARAFIGRLALR